MLMRALYVGLSAMWLAGGLAAAEDYAVEVTDQDRARLEAVKTFADNVLEQGRDRYGEAHTPLFVDGFNTETMEPVRWEYDGNEWIISNQANQQNLFRTLTGLTNLTGDERYKAEAKAAIRHMFEHQRSECGLLYWGGHQFVELENNTNVGEFDADCHEFKWSLPYYELMWEVDPDATQEFLEALWNAHILDWGRLDMNRHGSYGRAMGDLWDNEFDYPEPFFEGRALTFINAGSDLIYAALQLHALTGDEGPRLWGLRLAELYVNARHPETKLGVYQYSQPERREEPPDDPRYTYSTYGDRAQRQFGPEFGDIALEGNFLRGDRGIYTRNALLQLKLAEQLGDAGEELLEWTREGMRAYAEHAYLPETNEVRPIWADGTDLTGFEIPRYGYFGPEGQVLSKQTASINFLYSYALGYRLTGDEALWEMARGVARGHGLGDLGERPGEGVDVNLDTNYSGPMALFALVDLYRAVEHEDYLALARRVGDNILEQRYHDGWFLPSPDHLNARVDAIEPLALLALDAVLRGAPEAVPQYNGGQGYIHGRFDGHGRTTDNSVIWNARR